MYISHIHVYGYGTHYLKENYGRMRFLSHLVVMDNVLFFLLLKMHFLSEWSSLKLVM